MNKRLLIYYGIGLTLVVGWFLAVHMPATAKRQRLAQEIDGNQSRLNQLEVTMRQLPDFLATHRQLLETRSDLQTELYSADELLELFAALETSAGNHGLTLTEISPPVDELLSLDRSDASLGEPQFLNLTLRLTGRYLDFGRYVVAQEAAPYFRGVNHCQILSPEDNRQNLDILLEMRVLLQEQGDPT